MSKAQFNVVDYNRIRPEHTEIHELLLNWARWCRKNPTRSHCMSIEHRYKSPPMYEPDAPSNPPNDRDGVMIEKIIRNSLFPEKFKAHLKCWYIQRSAPGYVSRIVGIPIREIEDHIAQCRAAVKNQLRIIQRSGINDENLIPS